MTLSPQSSAVFVVLATYNGARYVNDQIESIRRQSYPDWTLLIRDDQSTDATGQLIGQLAAADKRIQVLDDGGPRLGAAQNFGRLLQEAYDRGARYVFAADQDDVWRPDKLHKQLARMWEVESAESEPSPQLVYSDLRVVDEHLQVVDPSFLRCSRLPLETAEPWKTLIGRSFVLGCACLVNRPLLEFALPLPPEAVMHDWWLALCASAVGRISPVAEPLVFYRRHGANFSGPVRFWESLNPLRHSWRQRWRIGTASFRQSLAQVHALRTRLDQRTPGAFPELEASLDLCCQVFQRSIPRARGLYELYRLGVPQIDLPRRLLYYLCLVSGGWWMVK